MGDIIKKKYSAQKTCVNKKYKRYIEEISEEYEEWAGSSLMEKYWKNWSQ